MSRPIKFRAWAKAINIMEFCVDLSPFHVGDCDRRRWRWDEVEVMQYTGLKDRNGKEIYEGDVWDNGTKRVVKFDEDRAGYFPFAKDDGCGCCSDETFSPETGEVIGNIYEHPHLLEGSA